MCIQVTCQSHPIALATDADWFGKRSPNCMACQHFDVIDRLRLENWCCYRPQIQSEQRCHSAALAGNSADADRYSVAVVAVASIAVDGEPSYCTDSAIACIHFALAESNCLDASGDFAVFAFAATTSKTAVSAAVVAHRYVQ